MHNVIISSLKPVIFIGGGEVKAETLNRALSLGQKIVAADGGARWALRAGHMPDAVIGDFDSIDADSRARIPEDRLHIVAEQDTTDFEKCLSRVRAPLIVAVGFAGGRVDHALAALNAIVRHPAPPCVLLNASDAVFHAPRDLVLDLPAGTRLSLFPMRAVTGRSTGLRWPIDGIDFAPDGRIGTSNEVTTPRVQLSFNDDGMLVALPVAHLGQVIAALMPG